MSKQNENEWLDSKSWQFENEWKNRLLNYNYKIDLQKMSKYYTPEIEEFHIGFECEIKLFDSEEYVKAIYSTITDEIFCKDSNGNIWTNDTIRVKYLDQEDIESLGWKRDIMRSHKLTKQLYNKENWILLHDTELNQVSIIIRDPFKEKDYIELFKLKGFDYLIVKNKSELKKLLKQLNIE